MVVKHHIKNPVEWGIEQLMIAAHGLEEAGRAVGGTDENRYTVPPVVRRIGLADLKTALARGIDDFGACRSDVILLCAIYPLLGLVLFRLAFGYDMLPLVFPLAFGFVLIGPVAAVGLYEMSRKREQGFSVDWANAFGVLRSPRVGAISLLGLMLLAVFVAWLVAAQAIYVLTLGPAPPESLSAFVSQSLTTAEGWAMIVAGLAVGFLFAVLVLMITVVSFPLLLDRDVGLPTAVATSMRAVAANPATMLAWGAFIVASVVIGSLPLFLGLAIVVPVLGHASWHLYRAVVEPV